MCRIADGPRQGYAPQPPLKDKSREELASILQSADTSDAGTALPPPQQKSSRVHEKTLVDLDSDSESSHSDLESDGEDFDAGDDSPDVPPPPYKA